MLLAFHKPCNVLTQFTPDQPGQRTLAEFGFPPRVYPLGRLDYDSEGLLLLSDEAGLNTRLLDPKRKHERTYWAQVEGLAAAEILRPLEKGVDIQGRKTLPAQARVIPEPPLPPRDPPIRFRANVPTSWVEVTLHEGRNRQVRRMTAAVGLPTLRLVRARIGLFDLPPELKTGTWREVTATERKAIFGGTP